MLVQFQLFGLVKELRAGTSSQDPLQVAVSDETLVKHLLDREKLITCPWRFIMLNYYFGKSETPK